MSATEIIPVSLGTNLDLLELNKNLIIEIQKGCSSFDSQHISSSCPKNMQERREKLLIADRKELDEFECDLQIKRITTIIHEALSKLEILEVLPVLLENDGEILRPYLQKTEADFIIMLANDGQVSLIDRPDLMRIYNMLNKINLITKSKSKSNTHLKKGSKDQKNIVTSSSNVKAKKKVPIDTDDDSIYEVEVAYAVDILFNTKPLLQYMKTVKAREPSNFIRTFQQSLLKFSEIVDYRLSVTAKEEVDREQNLKLSYRTYMILTKNIKDLEEQLEKQRQELNTDHKRKDAILKELETRLNEIKDKAKDDISRIVNVSETIMMKEYNESVEHQQELAEEAKEATDTYNQILEQHLNEEKSLRSKRFKAQTQLASWIAKYDQDIGEKQAEYEKLEEFYKNERDEYDKIMEDFEEQEKEYLALMAEKDAEETRINEEKAWIFLQNRSARRIQKCWRAYKERKLARKRARKGKKGKQGKKAKKERKSQKDKKSEPQTSLKGGPDPNALLDSKFDSELMADFKEDSAFEQKDIVVDLNN